jgi:hypothetical protein
LCSDVQAVAVLKALLYLLPTRGKRRIRAAEAFSTVCEFVVVIYSTAIPINLQFDSKFLKKTCIVLISTDMIAMEKMKKMVM